MDVYPGSTVPYVKLGIPQVIFVCLPFSFSHGITRDILGSVYSHVKNTFILVESFWNTWLLASRESCDWLSDIAVDISQYYIIHHPNMSTITLASQKILFTYFKEKRVLHREYSRCLHKHTTSAVTILTANMQGIFYLSSTTNDGVSFFGYVIYVSAVAQC